MKITFIYTLFSVLILSTVTTPTMQAYSIIPGTIQFPQNISKTPTTRVYHGGEIRQCTIDQDKRTITFNIPKYPQQSQFHVLFTETIDFSYYTSKYQTSTNNTAAYVKLKDQQPYLLFTLTLIPKITKTKDGDSLVTHTWHIDKVTNRDKNNKIPDDAIIICLDPDWIHSMKSYNSFEFPTILIKQNIFELSGSEKAFYEQAVRLQLAAIDSDTLHSTSSQQIMKQEQNRIMIAAPTA